MFKLLFLLFFFNSVFLGAQNRYYTDPVKIPMFLSGSFAELRSNHFHSGIDIKTQGVVGIPVFSVADGFISRIAVSPAGFGNAIYIDHPNGTTSVYGHLNAFRADISNYIKDIQYKNKSFRTDINLPANAFPVKQDEQIATSGNTGSSGGPHLHFEIRNTKTEEPINPLKYDFNITDKTAPKLFSILVVPLSNSSQVNYNSIHKSYPLVYFDGKYHLKNNPIVPASGEIGIAIHANDFFDNTNNKCGIYSVELKMDGEVCYSHQIDRFSFDETRFINAHIVYDEFINSKIRYQKTWIEPGNKLRIYNFNKNKGILNIENGSIHHIELILKDTYGNTAELNFNVEGKRREIKPSELAYTEDFKFTTSNYWAKEDFNIEIPEGSLYNNLNFYYSKIKTNHDFYSDIHVIHKNTTPLHKSASIKIKTRNLPKHLQNKALLVNVDTINGKFYAAGGEYENGWINANIRNFGNYVVAVDTMAPKIVPLSIKTNSTLSESNRIRFKISDDLAGINEIEGLLDNKWALFEYDAKRNLITHTFDNERFEFQKRHNLILKVTDYKENTTIYEASFWK